MAEEKSTLENPTEENNSPKPQQNKVNKKKPGFNIYWIYGLIAIAIFGLQFINWTPSIQEIDEDHFFEMLKNNEISKVIVVNQNKGEVYLKDSVLRAKNSGKKSGNSVNESGPHYYFSIGYIDDFKERINLAQKEGDKKVVNYINRKDWWGEIIGWIFPVLILIGIWVFIFRRMGTGGPGGNIFNIGKSRAKVFDKEESQVKTNFQDVAGLAEAKIEVTEIVDFLKNPEKYTRLGGKIPKGALLIGPPGTGKTLLGKAVAGEANVPFFSMSGSDFVEMFVGVGASRVRDLFSQAKSKAPCIIFIDEVDAIGRARGRNPNFGSNDERENTLNQLLTEMDGFDTNTGVIILAATNRADVLDPALLRAGRFDRQIVVELPDLHEREEIFKVHLRPIKVAADLQPAFLAKQTPGFSGADIANMCNESALIAARKSKDQVEKQDFLDAVDRIVGGLEKKNKIITPLEKKTIAYHEAGHAVVSWLLEYAHPLIKVTIVPRGRALGAAWYLPEERQLTTKEQIFDEMCAGLGGRVSEEINFGRISTGALNDLEKVTKQAYAMVAYFGMSNKIGNRSFFDSTGQNEFAFHKPYSEKTAELIDEEANKILLEAYEKAKSTLLDNKEGLIKLAELLLEREVIFTEDVEIIFGKRKYGLPAELQSELKF